MRANSEYQLRQEIVSSRGVEPGTWMPFHTGLLDGRFPPVSIPHPRAAGSASADKLLVRSVVRVSPLPPPLRGPAMDPWYNMATDLEGNVVWTLPSPAFLTRVLSGGRFLVLADGANSQNDMRRLQLLREVDLLGNTVRRSEERV